MAIHCQPDKRLVQICDKNIPKWNDQVQTGNALRDALRNSRPTPLTRWKLDLFHGGD
jgi:hypothetical protein